jgi:7-cyano-7-deazaguanine synthase
VVKRPDIAITLDYGQKAAEAEIGAAKTICQSLDIEHHIVRVDCSTLGSGDMAGTAADVNAPSSDWWPYRNQMLISLAAMKAITLGITHLWIGTVKSDGTHLDGTPDFVRKINDPDVLPGRLNYCGSPAIHLSTTELIRVSGIAPEHWHGHTVVIKRISRVVVAGDVISISKFWMMSVMTWTDLGNPCPRAEPQLYNPVDWNTENPFICPYPPEKPCSRPLIP